MAESKRFPALIVVILFGAAAAIVILARFLSAPALSVVRMEPGLDGAPAGSAAASGIRIGSYHRQLETNPDPASAGLQGRWPGFRGAERDATAHDGVALAETWGDGGPVELWRTPLGEGHAGAALYDGRVYLLDYDEARSMDLLRCFDLVTGTEYWQTGYSNPIKRNHGRSRTVPAVTPDCVITLGPQGHVMAVAREDGSFLWGLDLAGETNAETPLWYAAQCPLVVGETLLLAPCGDALALALDCRTGETLWSIPNDLGLVMSHASIVPMTLDGVPQYVYAALGGVFGFTLEGELLWFRRWNPAVIAPSPVAVGERRIYLCAGYGVGSLLLEVRREGGAWTATESSARSPTEGLSCEQQTPVVADGRLFGILPKDAGPRREEFACADLEGNVLWTSGQDARFGLGPWILAGGKFLILGDDGTLFMSAASAQGWRLLDTARVTEGVDAWGPLALADGYLVLRDSTTLVCLDLNEGSYR